MYPKEPQLRYQCGMSTNGRELFRLNRMVSDNPTVEWCQWWKGRSKIDGPLNLNAMATPMAPHAVLPQAKHRLFSFRAHQVHKPLAWAYRWPEECDPLDLIEHAKCMAVTDAPHWWSLLENILKSHSQKFFCMSNFLLLRNSDWSFGDILSIGYCFREPGLKSLPICSLFERLIDVM